VAGVELAAVIAQLRADLSEALVAGDGERLRFELGPVELELSLTVAREATPTAKVRFWVVEAGTEATLSRQSVQTVKLTLTPFDATLPVGADGGRARPVVRGEALPGEN
jgi:hypothetical protein